MTSEIENLVKNNVEEYCGGDYDEKVSECCEASSCCKKFLEFEADTRTLIKYLDLSSLKKNVLIRRYSDVIADYEKKRDCVRFAYRLFQMIVTIGSILTPSLLSIQMTEHVKDDYEIEINIAVWIISVFVSISNGIVNLFKLEELYAQCALTCEKLKTLWYKYITLTEPFNNTTHEESFNLFITKMEELILEQKFSEFVDSKANKNKPKQEEIEFMNNLNNPNNLDNQENQDNQDNQDNNKSNEDKEVNKDKHNNQVPEDSSNNLGDDYTSVDDVNDVNDVNLDNQNNKNVNLNTEMKVV